MRPRAPGTLRELVRAGLSPRKLARILRRRLPGRRSLDRALRRTWRRVSAPRTREENEALFEREFKEHRERVRNHPVRMSIDVTGGCSANCLFCDAHSFYGAGDTAKKLHITDERLERRVIENYNNASIAGRFLDKLAPFLQTTRGIEVQQAGEPLQSTQLWRVLDSCKSAETRKIIFTNGIPLTDTRIEKLLEYPNLWINVSLNAASPESYETFITDRVPFETVVDNVRRLVCRRDQLGTKASQRITLSFLMMRDVLADVPRVVELAAELGVDGLAVRHITPDVAPGEFVLERRGFRFDYGEQRMDLYPQESNRVVRALRKQAADLGVELVATPALFDEAGQSEDAHLDIRRCWEPWGTFIVQSNGRYSVCCRSEKQIGHLDEAPALEEIWNGEKLRTLRREIKAGRVPEYCRGANCVYVNKRASKW